MSPYHLGSVETIRAENGEFISEMQKIKIPEYDVEISNYSIYGFDTKTVVVRKDIFGEEQIDTYFLFETECRVSANCVISLHKTEYEIHYRYWMNMTTLRSSNGNHKFSSRND